MLLAVVIFLPPLPLSSLFSLLLSAPGRRRPEGQRKEGAPRQQHFPPFPPSFQDAVQAVRKITSRNNGRDDRFLGFVRRRHSFLSFFFSFFPFFPPLFFLPLVTMDSATVMNAEKNIWSPPVLALILMVGFLSFFSPFFPSFSPSRASYLEVDCGLRSKSGCSLFSISSIFFFFPPSSSFLSQSPQRREIGDIDLNKVLVVPFYLFSLFLLPDPPRRQLIEMIVDRVPEADHRPLSFSLLFFFFFFPFSLRAISRCCRTAPEKRASAPPGKIQLGPFPLPFFLFPFFPFPLLKLAASALRAEKKRRFFAAEDDGIPLPSLFSFFLLPFFPPTYDDAHQRRSRGQVGFFFFFFFPHHCD